MNKQEIKRIVIMEDGDKKYICYDVLMECLAKNCLGDIFDHYLDLLLEVNKHLGNK